MIILLLMSITPNLNVLSLLMLNCIICSCMLHYDVMYVMLCSYVLRMRLTNVNKEFTYLLTYLCGAR